MNTPSAPAAPDPNATAAAQAKYNREAAQSQAQINMVNQSTPYGSLTYKQSGTAADGTPMYTATTELSPDMKSLYDNMIGTQKTLGSTAGNLAAAIQSMYSQPFNTNQAVEDKIVALGKSRLDPQIAQQRAALETQLTNQGVTQGSEAWNTAIKNFTQNSGDQYNQLYLTGSQQALAQALAERQLPLSELQQMLGMSSPTNPTFTSTPQEQIAAPNYQGMVSENYANQVKQQEIAQSQNNALIGGLASLGGAALGGWTSGAFKGMGGKR